jgi:predicted RNase H-like HicB family nuclease
MKKLTAIFEEAEEGGYICWIEEIPTAMSQGETLKEAKENLLDALNLLIEVNREESEKAIKGHKNIIRDFIPLSALAV